MDDDRGIETQTFDTQSVSKSDHILKVWTGNEYRSTEPFGDTVALESPPEGTQLENIDTELLVIPDSVDDMATQMLEDYKEEVVLDSDDEGVHETETACSKELTSGELQRIVGGDVLEAPCARSEDFVVGSVASSHKNCTAVYKRRRVNSVCPQTVQCAGLGGGSMSENVSSIGPSSIQKDSTLRTSEHESAEKRYNEYEEPGDSSQANALSFVDHYLSFNKVNLSKEVAPKKTRTQKSPPALCAKGPQILARRAILGTTFGISGTFEWDANEIDGGEGDRLKDTKNLILNGEGPEATSVARCLSDTNLNVQSQMKQRDQCKEKFKGEMIDAYSSNSSLIVLNSEEVGDVLEASGMKFVKEMDDQLNAEASEQQLEAGGLRRDVPDTFDVGFDTQMAAEAMEALFYAPPPNSNVHSTPQDPENMVEDSSKCSTGKCSNSGVTARKLKPKNKPSKKLSGKIIRSSRKDKRSREELDPELPEVNKVKRRKSLGESPPNAGNPSNVENHSRRSSFKLIERRKEEKVTERDNINKVDNNLVSSTSVERRMFSALAHQNRSRSLVHPLEEAKNPTKSSEQRMSDVMEAGVLKKRKKNGQNADTFQVSSLGGKRPKIGLRTSKKAKDVEVSKPAEDELDVGSHLTSNEWGYCKGKRTHRNLPCHSNGVSDICLPSTVVKGEKGDKDFMDIHKKSQVDSETNCGSAESHKKSQGNSEISCFSFYVRRKRRSPACAHRILPSPVEKSEEKSGKLDRVVLVSSADGANESIELDIRSRGNAEFSLSKCPSPVNFSEGVDLAPSILNGNEKGKQLLTRKISRFPLMKELNSLGFSGSLPKIRAKDLRQRRDMANVRVLFSNNLDNDIIKQQKKILARLGSSIASCCSDATHFVADRFVRTRNMLESIALGKPVVTQLWLDSCGQARCFIDEKNYILRDAKKEKEIGFSMPVSLAHARQHPLLKQDLRVIVSSNIKPGKELILSLVKAVHGQVVDRIQETAMMNKMIPKDVLILSCEQDYELCAPFLDKGAAVYSSELLLNGIVTQKLEFERHRLFKNHVNSNCSRIGLKKSGEWSLPVAMCQ
ncbi:uncharacterized protein LOC131322814 isoform X1 [Rhododendron vialii]|uniref:uncharacterized protein LOC131322814 isoform X1 n=1 Tax=Rhododendron vialii TaxID=182163 RepID=UPI00265EBF13|nr:uncharacterized protein LOC131322814 isoform X1 [Rhododendron vialii]